MVCKARNGDYLSTAGSLGGTSIYDSFEFQLNVASRVNSLSFVGISKMQYIWDNNIGARLKITLKDGTNVYANLSLS